MENRKSRMNDLSSGQTSEHGETIKDSTQCVRRDESAREWEQRVTERLKRDHSPQRSIEDLELADIIDSQAIQSMMDDFYRVVRIPMSIIDLKGKVLVGVGWQDICVKFHRTHSETCTHCLESDIRLSAGIAQGEFRLYKCLNNMWDIATPLFVCEKHMGNVLSGRFFFDDEPIDYDLFMSQARKYGFDENEYMAALESVPRLRRSQVEAGMSFFIKIADVISSASYDNINLAQSLVERDALMVSLRESRKDLNRAQAVAHTGSWRMDVRLNELTWSEETYRIFAIPEGTLLTYEKFLSFVHPEDRENVDREWSAALRGEPYEIEHRIIVGDTVKWVREKAELEFGMEGSLLGGFGTVQDITERKRAEEARFRALVEASSNVSYRMSPDWSEMRQLHSRGFLANTEGPSRTWFQEYIHPDDQSHVMAVINKAIRNRSIFELEHRVLRVDGTVGWAFSRAIPLLDANGEIVEWFGAASDITEAKRAEEALRESEERQSFLLELSDRLRPLSDARKIMTAASEVLARRLGLSSVGYCEIKEDGETVIARGDYSDGRMPSQDDFCFRQSSNSDFIRSLRAGEARFYENNRTAPKADSENVILGDSIQLVAGAAIPLLKDGRLVAYLYAVHPDPRPWPDKERRLMREVAERTWGAVQRARAEKALRESEQRYKSLNAELELRVNDRTAELERKNHELQEFAFVASHDLSEPLRKIQAFGSLLSSNIDIRLGDKERDLISRMTGAANRMQELLDALLRYSRIDTKGLELRSVRLNDVVQDAANDLEIAIRDAGVKVEIGPLPSIKCDPYQWRQLFQNLISNAAKYHRSEVKPFIKIYEEENEGACRIFVEDNGIGFDEKYLDKIFQPFQRLHGRNEYPGTGMGLAICKKIVERHRGTVTAKSIPGKGSTFIITLPLDGTSKPE